MHFGKRDLVPIFPPWFSSQINRNLAKTYVLYICESLYVEVEMTLRLFFLNISRPPGNIVRRITPYTAWEELPYRERQGWQNRGSTRKNIFALKTLLRQNTKYHVHKTQKNTKLFYCKRFPKSIQTRNEKDERIWPLWTNIESNDN